MSSDGTPADTVYRTLQNGKRLREQHVGPLFTNKEEAKRALEHFIETEHNAEVTEWEQSDDGAEKMLPDGSSSVFYVREVKVRDSLDELLEDKRANEGTEVAV